MDCKAIQDLLPAYQDQELASGEMAAVRTHLSGCPTCASELRLFSQSWDMLGTLETIQPSPDFRTRFWERVRQEETRSDLWDWIRWPRLVPALAGFIGIWLVGISLGVATFMHSHPASFSARSNYETMGIMSPIESAYLQRVR